MNINSSNPSFTANASLQAKRNNIAFGYKVFVDSGASDPYRGSFKIKVESDDGKKVLFATDQIPEKLEKVGRNGKFTTAKDYVDGLSANIVESLGLIKDKLAELKEKLTGVCINVPCYVKDNKAKIVANIRDKKDQSILDVDFSQIKGNLQKAGIELEESKFKLLATNDLAGAAAGIAEQMASNPKYQDIFKEGFYGVCWMTGGGTGVADIKVKDGVVQIETSESGHNRAVESKKNRSLEKYGGSSPALIRNYCQALGMKDKDINALLTLGKAKLITQYPMKLDKGSEAEKEFMATGLFKIVKDDGKRVGLKLKGVDKKAHLKASKVAIDKYMESLAQLCAMKVDEGAQYIILSGPMALRVREDIDDKSKEMWDGKSFKDMVIEKTRSYLDETGNKMLDLHNLEFICDIEIPDNTVGGRVLIDDNTRFIGQQRGNWINIPMEKLVKK